MHVDWCRSFCTSNSIKVDNKITNNLKLLDLKVLKRSPDLLNNVKIGLGQLQLIMKHVLFYYIWGLWSFWSNDLKQSSAYSIK